MFTADTEREGQNKSDKENSDPVMAPSRFIFNVLCTKVNVLSHWKGMKRFCYLSFCYFICVLGLVQCIVMQLCEGMNHTTTRRSF